MQDNPDQGALSSPDAPSDLLTSNGEVVRRADLDAAACQPDPGVAIDARISLAKAALAGDKAALDKFHDLEGLALPGVTEHCYKDAVRFVALKSGAVAFLTTTDEYSSTAIDAAEIVAWILSPDGRSALARRGVVVPTLATDLPASSLTYEEAVESPARLELDERQIERLVREVADRVLASLRCLVTPGGLMIEQQISTSGIAGASATGVAKELAEAPATGEGAKSG